MCMGCAEAALMSGDGKTPDTMESAVYLVGFAVWIFLLAHFANKQKILSFVESHSRIYQMNE